MPDPTLTRPVAAGRPIILLVAVLALAVLASGGRRQRAQAAPPRSPDSLPRQAGHLGGHLRAFDLVPGMAYVAFGPELARLDLTQPGDFRRVDYLVLDTLIEDVAAGLDHAFVAAGEDGLQLVRFDAVGPHIVSEVGVAGQALAVVADGPLIYMGLSVPGGSFGQVTIVDATLPSAPVVRGVQSTNGPVDRLVVDDGVLFAATTYGVLEVIDVADPANPALLTSLATAGAIKGLDVNADRLYAVESLCLYTCDGRFRIYDIASPATPQVLGDVMLSGRPVDLAVAGQTAYGLDSQGRVHIVDVADAMAPVALSTTDYVADGRRLGLQDATLHVGSATDGLHRYDISNPLTLAPNGLYNPPATVRSVTTVDDHLYVAADRSLTIIDAADPGLPTPLGRLALPGDAHHIALDGTRAYVAAGAAGLRVVDIVPPTAPVERGAFTGVVDARRVAVKDAHAYIADRAGGLHIVDISDPGQPVGVGYYYSGEPAWDVDIAGDVAYLAADVGGLHVVDVSTPGAPQLLSVFNTPGSARGVAVNGGLALVADAIRGLRFVDVADPANPKAVGAFDLDRETWQVAAGAAFAFVAEGDVGYRALDLTDLATPLPLDHHNTPGFARDLFLGPDHLLVADGGGGLHLYNYLFAATGRVLQANDAPYSGAFIQTDSGQGVISGAAGYSFDLSPGAYTLIPHAGDFVFSPATLTAVVPTAMIGLDFLVLAAPATVALTPAAPATLTVDDTQGLPTTLAWPAGAVTGAVTAHFTPTIAAPAPALTFAGHAFDLAVSNGGKPLPGYMFQQTVSVTVAYSAADVAAVSDEAALELFRWDGGRWQAALSPCFGAPATTVDTANKLVQAALCRDGVYALFAQRQELFLPIIHRFD